MKKRILLPSTLLMLTLAQVTQANELSSTFKKISEDAKTAGKDIGKASQEVGREIAKGSKAVAKDAKEAGHETKSWWDSLWED